MFTKFAAIYGHVWRSQFKDEKFLTFAKKEWCEALSQFSDELIDKSTMHCREWLELPPTLPQFIGICRQITHRNNFFVADKTTPKATPSIVEFNIQQCRNYLTL